MNQDIYVVIEHLHGQLAEISCVMLAGAHELAKGSGGKVVAVLLGDNTRGFATNPLAGSNQYLSADKVLSINNQALAEFTSDAWLKVLADLITRDQPRAVLFGSTSIGTDLASSLSLKLGIPIVSSCRSFGEGAKFTSQICGGKIMAEGILPAPIALVTMVPGGYKTEQGLASQAPVITEVECPPLDSLRVSLNKYIEPESGDVDIAREPILVSVGRGIQTQDNLVLAEDLAKALGGVVSGSRPVIDQGWLATSRLVGKSGKSVKPKVYLALGISGAPEHVEGITNSDTIIAINTDKAAPIFGIAKYGSVIDLFDLVEILTGKIKQSKGG